MNRLGDSRSIFSQILRRYHHQPTTPWRRRRLIDVFSSVREFITIPRARPAVHPSSTVSPLHLRYGTRSPQRFVLRWYHEPQKVTLATAIALSATVMAACSRYDREIVPCTYRSHLVLHSHQELCDIGDSAFAEYSAKFEILNPNDPRSVRVHRIAERIVHAAHRGLGIYDSNDAPMLRVTEKRRMPGKAQPNTSHLRQLKWEVILIKDDNPCAGVLPSGKITVNTGLFNWFKTDEEIAAVLAHEVAHIIARHSADINTSTSLYELIFLGRQEIEADYIGMLLLGAAGFHPQWFHVIMEKFAKFERLSLSHPSHPQWFHVIVEKFAKFKKGSLPSPEKRLQLLSEGKTMKEALELYNEATAMDKVTERYFR
ncbi:unnamed protein product [Alopecurus aequalis]